MKEFETMSNNVLHLIYILYANTIGCEGCKNLVKVETLNLSAERFLAAGNCMFKCSKLIIQILEEGVKYVQN